MYGAGTPVVTGSLKGDEELNNEKREVEVICKVCGNRMFDMDFVEGDEMLNVRQMYNRCRRCKRTIDFLHIKKKELLKPPKHVVVNGTYRWRLYF